MGYERLRLKADESFLVPWPQRLDNAYITLIDAPVPKPDYYDEIASQLKKVEVDTGIFKYKYYVFGNPRTARKTHYIVGGRRSLARGNVDVFKAASDCNEAVIFLQLKNVKKADYLDRQRDIVAHFLANLPYKAETQRWRRHLYGHSTGAWAIVDNLHTDFDGVIPYQFNRIKNLNAFFKAPIDNSPTLAQVYNWYSVIYADYSYGDTLPDRIYGTIDKLWGEELMYAPKRPNKVNRAKHRENAYMRPEIQKRTAKLLETPFPQAIREADNIKFFHGEWDRVACINEADKIAQHMDAPFIVMPKTFHTPYTQQRLIILFTEIERAICITDLQQPTPSRLFESAGRRLPDLHLTWRSLPESKATD